MCDNDFQITITSLTLIKISKKVYIERHVAGVSAPARTRDDCHLNVHTNSASTAKAKAEITRIKCPCVLNIILVQANIFLAVITFNLISSIVLLCAVSVLTTADYMSALY